MEKFEAEEDMALVSLTSVSEAQRLATMQVGPLSSTTKDVVKSILKLRSQIYSSVEK